jgi:hypothetical protein
MKKQMIIELTAKEQILVSGGSQESGNWFTRLLGFIIQSHSNSMEYHNNHPSVLPYK